MCHDIFAQWFDLAMQSVEEERKYDQLLANYFEIQNLKKLNLYFQAFRTHLKLKNDKKYAREQVFEFANEIYEKNLMKKGM